MKLALSSVTLSLLFVLSKTCFAGVSSLNIKFDQNYSLNKLIDTLPTKVVTIKHNPPYNNGLMQYHAFPIESVLKNIFDIDINHDDISYKYLNLYTTDYYTSKIPLSNFKHTKNKAYLAYKQILKPNNPNLSKDGKSLTIKIRKLI